MRYTYELNATHIPCVCNCHKYSYFIIVMNSLCGHSKGAKLHFNLTSPSLCLGCNNLRSTEGIYTKFVDISIFVTNWTLVDTLFEDWCIKVAASICYLSLDGAGYSKVLVNFKHITWYHTVESSLYSLVCKFQITRIVLLLTASVV